MRRPETGGPSGPETESRRPRPRNRRRQIGQHLAVASTISGALLLGTVGGWWLDQQLGTGPWITVVGTFLGIAVGMYELGRIALRSGPNG